MRLTGPHSTIQRAKKLRREMTLPEILLWQHLRARPAGIKFRRQHPAGPYILDFYADALRLAIEVDGEAHERGTRPQRDTVRDRWLAERGVRTVRIPARAVLNDPEGVIRYIVDTARPAAPSTSFAGPPPPAGEE